MIGARRGGESAVLRRLLALAMAPGPPRWPELAPAVRRAVQACYFLLDADPAGDAEILASQVLERLLRQLSHTTEQRQVEYRGRLRGRIGWPATFKARASADYDPTRYVCRAVHHDFDTPENQLLKFVVERVHECLQVVPEIVRCGTCYFPAMGGRDALAIASRLGRMEPAVNSFRRNARLRTVTLPEQIGERHLLRAETASLEEYATVAHIYRRYQALVGSPRWHEQVAVVGKRMLLLPERWTPESDPWIRLGAAILRS